MSQLRRDRAPLHHVAARLFFAAALLIPSVGNAQTVDLGGHAGFYLPVGSLIDGPPVEKRAQGAIMLGVDAFVWATGRLGFAGKVAYAPSPVAVIQAGNVTDRLASVILANARVLFAVTPLTKGTGADRVMSPLALYVGAGGGLVNRSGVVWSDESGLTSPALVFNVGVQTPGSSRVVMRIELEDYLSRVQFNAGAPDETAAQTHHDLAFYLSLSYRVRE